MTRPNSLGRAARRRRTVHSSSRGPRRQNAFRAGSVSSRLPRTQGRSGPHPLLGQSPAVPVPQVVTIHDLTTILVPEYRRSAQARAYNALVSAARAAPITLSPIPSPANWTLWIIWASRKKISLRFIWRPMSQHKPEREFAGRYGCAAKI